MEGVFSKSEFGKALEARILSIPCPQPLPSTTQPALTFVSIGDEAFS